MSQVSLPPSFIVGVVKAEDEEQKRSIEDHIRDLVPYCEAHGWEDKKWSFRADFAEKKYLNIEDDELLDMMRTIFPILLDLRHFYEASFRMVIYCDHQRRGYTLEASMVAMCSALNMDIEIITALSRQSHQG